MSKNSSNKKKMQNAKNFMSRPWTDQELETLYAMKEDGIPYKIIAVELKRTVNACEKKYRSTVWEDKEFFDTRKRNMKDSFKRAHLDKIVKAHNNKLEAEKFRTDIIADKIAMSIEALPKVKKSVYSGPRNKKHISSAEDVGLMFSDAHVGHHHTLEETGGLSEYNIDIFKERIEKLKESTAEIVELHSNLYKLPTLHLFSLGDIVAGMNNSGNWSPIYINMPIYDQMIAGFEAISDMIYYWLGLFENINFYGVVGNHGRSSFPGVEKEYVNWDFLCYNFLEARFKDNPRVKFICPKTWWIMTEIRNHKFLLIHGEDVKSGSLPIQNLMKYEEKMLGIIKEIPDYTLAGHFHSAAELSTNHGRLIINSSFVGPDVYSLKKLQKGGKPEQKIFGIHDKRGITWSYNIDLSKR